MGASAQPSASGMPPKTSGWRGAVVVGRSRVADGRRTRSDTGTPGTTGKRQEPGEGDRAKRGAAVRPRCARRTPAGAARAPRTTARQSRASTASSAAAGCAHPVEQGGGRGALGATGLGGVDRHVVEQRGEQRADEGVGGLRLGRELRDAGPRAEVHGHGHLDDAVVLAQTADAEGDLGVLGGERGERGEALAGGPAARPQLDVDDHRLVGQLGSRLCVECTALHCDRPLSLA